MTRQTRRIVRPLALVFVTVALAWWSGAAPRAQADAYAPDLFKALSWRSIGPERGGRSLASAGVVGRPDEYYFGAVGGGLWKTTDGGVTWKPVTDGQIRSSSVGAVAVSESDPDTVYIGMGEVCLRGNIMQGDGIYKSTDAGKTWTHMGLADSQVIAKIVVSPTDPNLVYAAAFGHVAGPNEERGVFRSRDGGRTWQKVLYRDAKTGAVDLVMDRNDPKVLYAALWEAYRLSYTMSSGGPGSGFFKTTDGGDTWTELTRKPGLPGGIDGRIGLAVSPADSSRVWALVENENGGVFRSDDGGETWTKTNDERKLRQRAFYYTHIFADPKGRDVVYVMNTGFYRSTDGGKTFPTTIRVPHGDNHNLWIDPTNPDRMIGSNDGGGTVSVNGGETWTDEDYPTAQFYHVTTTSDFPYHVCGAQQDNTTACVSSEARLGGGGVRTAPVFYSVGGGESGYITQSPTDPDVFYAGSQGALLTRYNRKTGEIRDIQVYPWFFSGEPSSALKERWQWTFPIVFSPKNPHALYTTSQHLWRTTNDGQTWERISPDLTLADPKTLGHSGGPITGDMNGPEIFATIFALAPSPFDENLIWTGSDDGLLYVTRDGGKSWTNVTPPDLPRLSRVSIIDASSHDPGTAYFAANRHLLDDRAPYIYRTHDFGKTWTKIVAGIRADDYAHAVREDPVKRGLLYAGTEHGVGVSFDDGDHWQSLSLNLPDTQIADMVVKGDDLVIGTHGRGFYVLDDISPLRQLSPEVTAADVWLFQPRDAIRSGNRAAIYYALRQPADKVTIEILDAKGAVVQTYSQTAAEEGKAAGRPAQSGGGFFRRGPEPPSTKAGLDEFEWDLRYPGHTTFPGMILWSASNSGPLAVPGTYQVRLTADGKTLTKSFQVKENPNFTDITQADLQKQFDLAIQIRDKTSDANNAVIKIRAIKSQVDDRLGKTKDARVRASGEALKQKLSVVEEALYQVKNRSNQDPLNFPIKLNNRLASLRRSVETGDAPPTDAAYVVFKEESALVDQQLGMLEETLQTELAAFNEQLRRVKLEPIVAK